MELPEILLLTGSAVAACALFILGVLTGMLISNRAADRAFEQQQAELEQAERERQARLLEQQEQYEWLPDSGRWPAHEGSRTDRDTTRPIDPPKWRPYHDTEYKRGHRAR